MLPVVQGIVRLSAADVMVAEAPPQLSPWWDVGGNWTLAVAAAAVAGWITVIAAWAVMPLVQRAAWRTVLGA